MGTISYSIPQSGLPNASEDPKVASALTALLTLVNGNIDVANLNPTAAILAAGTWAPLTLATNVIALAGGYVPSARLEGDIVRLKGQLQNTTGGLLLANSTWATLPAGKRPSATVIVACNVSTVNSSPLASIATSGVLTLLATAAPNNQYISLDGITFTLS